MGGIMMPYMADMSQQGYVLPSSLPNLSLWYNGSASATVVNGVSTNNFNVAVSNGTLITSWIDLQNVAGPSNVNGGTGNGDAVNYAPQIRIDTVSLTGGTFDLTNNSHLVAVGDVNNDGFMDFAMRDAHDDAGSSKNSWEPQIPQPLQMGPPDSQYPVLLMQQPGSPDTR